MIGTLLNVTGILVGGVISIIRRKPFSPASEAYFKVLLSVFTVFYGLRLTWLSISGSPWQVIRQVFIVVLALMLGKLTGRFLHLQKMSNRLGQGARRRIAEIKPGKQPPPGEGFTICATLFCAAPLAILGSV